MFVSIAAVVFAAVGLFVPLAGMAAIPLGSFGLSQVKEGKAPEAAKTWAIVAMALGALAAFRVLLAPSV